MESVNRLDFVGPLDFRTPEFVILDVAHSYGLDVTDLNPLTYRAFVMDELHRIGPPAKVHLPLTDDELENVVLFVNPESSVIWDEFALTQAYLCTLSHLKTMPSKPIKHDDVCDPTPAKPKSIAPFVVYAWLRRLNVDLNFQTTVDQAVDIFNRSLNVKALRKRALAWIRTASDHELVTHFAGLDLAPVGEDTDINYEQLPQLLTNMPTIVPRLLCPETATMAVAFGLHFFHRDLSYSSQPIRDFRRHARGKTSSDARVRTIELSNCHAYDIRHTFNPKLPMIAYGSDLERLATRSGLKVKDVPPEVMYMRLQTHAMIDTFYQGLLPTVENVTSPILCNDVTQPDAAVITFGSFSTGFTAFTVDEFSGHFRVQNDFVNPCGGQRFTSESMVCLKAIVARRQRHARHGKVLWRDLYNVINHITNYHTSLQGRSSSLSELCQDFEVRTFVVKLLQDIFEMAMIMRGWRKQQPYPVSVVPTCDKKKAQLKTQKALVAFTTVCDQNPVVAKRVLSLPLVHYTQGNWVTNGDAESGLTIGDRLAIVGAGKGTGNKSACIRSSSNWLAASSNYYLMAVGEDPRFKIEQLRSVF